MFDKREYRMYRDINREEIFPKIFDYWTRQGFYVTQLLPYQIHGQSYQQHIGLHREFFLRLDQYKKDTHIDLQFRAVLSQEGMVGGIAAAVVFWPAAVVGGAVSYSEYENEAKNLMLYFWNYLDNELDQKSSLVQTPLPTQPYFPPLPPPPPPPQYSSYQHVPPYSPPPIPPIEHGTKPQNQTKVKPKRPLSKSPNTIQKPIKSSSTKPKPVAVVTPPKKLKLISMKWKTNPCNDCGALLPNNWKACPYCGKPIVLKK